MTHLPTTLIRGENDPDGAPITSNERPDEDPEPTELETKVVLQIAVCIRVFLSLLTIRVLSIRTHEIFSHFVLSSKFVHVRSKNPPPPRMRTANRRSHVAQPHVRRGPRLIR